MTGSKSLIYVFVNWWCKSLIFQNKAILTNRIRSLNYQNQRYRDFINLEFVVNSFPLNSIVNTRSCYLMTCEWYSCFLTITIQERTFFANYRSFHLALVFFWSKDFFHEFFSRLRRACFDFISRRPNLLNQENIVDLPGHLYTEIQDLITWFR